MFAIEFDFERGESFEKDLWKFIEKRIKANEELLGTSSERSKEMKEEELNGI